MILAEKEPTLTGPQADVRAKVLVCLQAAHGLFEFDTVQELTDYLEQGLSELEAAGYPKKLTRIVLFYRTAEALRSVTDRMHPMGNLVVANAPQCWAFFQPRLDVLIKNARRVEPTWIADMLKEM